jgi:hypothetical protein
MKTKLFMLTVLALTISSAVTGVAQAGNNPQHVKPPRHCQWQDCNEDRSPNSPPSPSSPPSPTAPAPKTEVQPQSQPGVTPVAAQQTAPAVMTAPAPQPVVQPIPQPQAVEEVVPPCTGCKAE